LTDHQRDILNDLEECANLLARAIEEVGEYF